MILCFDKPAKLRDTKEHNEMYSSDSGIAGTYVPNMSKADKLKWKAKYISGNDQRIEIRKTIDGVQLLIVVYKNPNPVVWDHKQPDNVERWSKRHQKVKISMNGKLDLTLTDYNEMLGAIEEALSILNL